MSHSYLRSGRVVLTFAVLACLLLAFQARPAAADEAASMYQSGIVGAIDLTLEPAAIAALEADPDTYQPGTFAFAPDATPGGGGTFTAPRKVEVRLKGNASFRDIKDGKSAFKLKFKKEEAFLGLRKMTLNNMVEDPSMTHETLAYAAFRAAGVPAPRTGFVNLRVNGGSFGVYLNLETLDEVALKNLFGAFDKKTQHLYEGELGADVRPGGAAAYEIDEGEESRADLEALIAAVNSSGAAPWSTRVAANADLAEMTRMWAVEHYVGHWDGYAGAGKFPFQPSNYYLYSDPFARFQMLPWGTDATFEEDRHLDFGQGIGLMFSRCIADQPCEATYRQSLASACSAIGEIGLDSLAASTATLLAPWQQAEQANSRHEYSLKEIAQGVAETREFVAARPAEAAAWLGVPCAAVDPPPATVVPQPEVPMISLFGKNISIGDEPLRMKVRRSSVVGSALVTRILLSAAGTVIQQAWIKTNDGPVVACRAEAEVKRARELTLVCPLTAAVRERLRKRWLRLSVTRRFKASTGATEQSSQRIVLKRTGS